MTFVCVGRVIVWLIRRWEHSLFMSKQLNLLVQIPVEQARVLSFCFLHAGIGFIWFLKHTHKNTMIDDRKKQKGKQTESLNELIFLLCKEFVFLKKKTPYLNSVFETNLLKHIYVSIRIKYRSLVILGWTFEAERRCQNCFCAGLYLLTEQNACTF